jgi:hypothetical protein
MKILFGLLFTYNLFAIPIKFRAREHFEVHKFKGNHLDQTFKGLSNTINIWWEDPYKFSIGLAFSPIISSLTNSSDTPLGKKIKLFSLGIEAKYFFSDLINSLYIRPGLFHTTLNPSSNLKNQKGYSVYLGIGYEVPLQYFSLAFELANKRSFLENSIQINSFTPSIGLHFYKKI